MELKLLICVAKQISCSKDISSVVMVDWIAGSTTSQTTPCHFLYSPLKPASQPVSHPGSTLFLVVPGKGLLCVWFSRPHKVNTAMVKTNRFFAPKV